MIDPRVRTAYFVGGVPKVKNTPAAGRPLFLVLIALLSGATLAAQDPTPVDDFDVVWEAVAEYYVDDSFGGVSWDAMREEFRPRVQSAPDVESAYGAIGEMLGRLENDDTFVIPPSVVPELATAAVGQREEEYAGVGVMISDFREVGVVVTGTFRESPAEGAGVLPGDTIVAVDGEPLVKEEGTQGVADRVRGPVGSEVTLTLRDPDGEDRDVTITRGRIDLRPSVDARVIRPGIGYIRLPAITTDLVQQASRALPALLSTSGIALDLRGIGTGTPEAMVVLAQWFLGPTRLGTIVTREESFPIPHRPDAIAAYRGPVVVITDSRTSGVAEVLAQVLREYDRARIVGATTRGGSQVAQVVPLPSGGLLHLVIARYVTPKGMLLHTEGIEPDVELAPPDLATIRAGEDPYLDRAEEIIRRGGRI